MYNLDIRFISNNEIDIFLRFLTKIARWLNENDKEMWSIDRLEKDIFLKNNKNFECYLGYIDDVPVASVILRESDEFMWPNVKVNETIFVGKLGVDRAYSGRGIGRYMLDFAQNEAIKRNKKYLRLDCYANRQYLCYLYEDYGFKLVEKKEMKKNLFAALYELKLSI